jgi:hypothetical protein
MDTDKHRFKEAAMSSGQRKDAKEWKSESDTVEKRDRERLPTDTGTGRESPGITNRKEEERESQQALPPRGTSRKGEQDP